MFPDNKNQSSDYGNGCRHKSSSPRIDKNNRKREEKTNETKIHGRWIVKGLAS